MVETLSRTSITPVLSPSPIRLNSPVSPLPKTFANTRPLIVPSRPTIERFRPISPFRSTRPLELAPTKNIRSSLPPIRMLGRSEIAKFSSTAKPITLPRGIERFNTKSSLKPAVTNLSFKTSPTTKSESPINIKSVTNQLVSKAEINLPKSAATKTLSENPNLKIARSNTENSRLTSFKAATIARSAEANKQLPQQPALPLTKSTIAESRQSTPLTIKTTTEITKSTTPRPTTTTESLIKIGLKPDIISAITPAEIKVKTPETSPTQAKPPMLAKSPAAEKLSQLLKQPETIKQLQTLITTKPAEIKPLLKASPQLSTELLTKLQPELTTNLKLSTPTKTVETPLSEIKANIQRQSETVHKLTAAGFPKIEIQRLLKQASTTQLEQQLSLKLLDNKTITQPITTEQLDQQIKILLATNFQFKYQRLAAVQHQEVNQTRQSEIIKLAYRLATKNINGELIVDAAQIAKLLPEDQIPDELISQITRPRQDDGSLHHLKRQLAEIGYIRLSEIDQLVPKLITANTAVKIVTFPTASNLASEDEIKKVVEIKQARQQLSSTWQALGSQRLASLTILNQN